MQQQQQQQQFITHLEITVTYAGLSVLFESSAACL